MSEKRDIAEIIDSVSLLVCMASIALGVVFLIWEQIDAAKFAFSVTVLSLFIGAYVALGRAIAKDRAALASTRKEPTP